MAALAPGRRVTAVASEALSAVVQSAEVVAVELVRVRIPLLVEHRAAHGSEPVRDVVLVRVELADGATGWGECSALAHPTYTEEYTAGAFALLRDELVPTLLGHGGGPVVGHPMATSAVIGAHTDAVLRRTGSNLASRLGSRHGRPAEAVPTAAVVGLAADAAEVVERVAALVDHGTALVKLKVTPRPAHLDHVRAVRSTWPDLPLAVDANGTLDHRSAAILDEAGLVYVEQPAPADDLLASAAVAERLSCPVAIDESATSIPAVATALAVGAATVVNVKPARLGGVHAAADLARVVVDAGGAAFVGGMLETGVGRATALALASLPLFALPTDLGPSDRYFADDVAGPLVADDNGRLVVPTAPGIGVEPDTGLLERFAVDRFQAAR